jgi:tetratricopeptide (TPR) repeat protein
MGQLLLLAKETSEARKKAELVLEKSPDNAAALSLLSGVQIQEKDLDGALETLMKARSLSPDSTGSHLMIARLLVMKNDLVAAEDSYEKAVSLDPVSLLPYVELAALHVKNGEWDKAETSLKKMVEVHERSHASLMVLARFYERHEKRGEAERMYLDAAAGAAKDDAVPLMDLASFYARGKDYEKALSYMKKAGTIKEDDLKVRMAIGLLQFDFERFEEAQATVDQVLEKDKGHVAANFLKGRIELRNRDFNGAVKRFDLVARERPRDAGPYYFRGLALLAKGERKLAEQDLIKAVELNPGLLEARLLLADFHVRDGNRDLARQEVRRLQTMAPDDFRVISLAGTVCILEKDLPGAEKAFTRAVALRPDDAAGQIRLGAVYRMMNRRSEALKAFRKALDIAPGQAQAMGMSLDLYVREKQYDEAFKLCRELKQKAKGDPNLVARAAFWEGQVYAAKGDLKNTVARHEEAIEADPNLLPAYIPLAVAYQREGKLSEAISKWETLLQKNPQSLTSIMALGTIYEKTNDPEKAKKYYRMALEVKRDFGPAANNLAWHLAQGGGNIDEALKFAQIAKEQLPEDPAVMDTLGWIYYLKGSYLNAILELEDSLKLKPEVPEVHYHLGLVHLKRQQPDLAKTHLEKALALAKDFEGAEEARKALAELGKGNLEGEKAR